MCHGNKCSKLMTTDGLTVITQLVSALFCHQEEEDARIFLHANDTASTGTSHIIIRLPDTDVLVIDCSFTHQILAQIICQACTKTEDGVSV